MAKRILIPFRHEAKVQPYVSAVSEAQMEAVPVHISRRPDLSGIAGLVLAGGTDVNARRYGEVPAPEADAPDDERDELESKLIAEALERDLPLLAICRGMQLLNVHLGGTLIQHLGCPSIHDPETEDKSAAAHLISIQPDSMLHSIAAANAWSVNSRHHQAAAKLGQGLAVVAVSPNDGVVEAVEMPEKRFVLGVQWHPEDQVYAFPHQLRLFRRLADSL